MREGMSSSSNMEIDKGCGGVNVERKNRNIGFVVEVNDVKDEEKLEHLQSGDEADSG